MHHWDIPFPPQDDALGLAKAAEATKSTESLGWTVNGRVSIYKYAANSINVELPRPCRRKQLPRRLEGGVVFESPGLRDVVSPSLFEKLKVTIFYQC